MTEPLLTALIIARDAGPTIAACVQALGFCDRVVVAENGSGDDTAEKARAAGAEVRRVAWEGYGQTKNRLIADVREGWIFSVDADEIATADLAREIKSALALDPPFAGFEVSRRNYFLGHCIRHCGWNPDWQLRLFRAGAGAFETRQVHEALRVRGTVGRLQHPLEHFTYRSVRDYLSRMNTYTSLAAQERQARGKRFSLARLLFDPPWTFSKMYFLKAGWLDGFPGLALCSLSALNTLVKHAKHWEMETSQDRPRA
ncbi:MAG: glycosyltransferase family 2 protein [candidate division FCPU426 bacterium]